MLEDDGRRAAGNFANEEPFGAIESRRPVAVGRRPLQLVARMEADMVNSNQPLRLKYWHQMNLLSNGSAALVIM
jgi:hypothetical protein